MAKNTYITWSAAEHVHARKTSEWYTIVTLIGAALAIASFIFGNVLFGILIVIVAFTLMLHASRPPRVFSYEISDKGIVAHRTLYPYKNLGSFSIHDEYPPNKLIIKTRRALVPHIHIPLGDIDPSDIRTYLRPHLQEEKHDPSLVEVLSDYLELYI